MTHLHPGEHLRRRLEQAGVTGYRIALATGISASTLTRVAIGERNIQPELAVLLAEYFGDDPVEWLTLQARYDVEIARQRLAPRLRQIRKRKARR